MRRTLSMIGTCALTAMLWAGVAMPLVHASESDSYSQGDTPQRAASMEAGSDDYEMTGNMTWYAEGASDDYSIIGEMEDEEEQDDGSAGGTTGGTTGGASVDETPSGGRRGSDGTPASQASQQSSRGGAARSSVRSRLPLRPAASGRPTSNTAVPRRFIQAIVLPDLLPASPEQATVHFFNAVSPACPVCVRQSCPMNAPTHYRQRSSMQGEDATSASLFRALFFFSGFMAVATGHARRKMHVLLHGKKKKISLRRRLYRFLHIALMVMGILTMLASATHLGDILVTAAHAEDTVPQYRMYSGQLRNASGQAITTPHTIRLSYWNTSDAVPSDLTATGSINVNAPQFLGWQEFHTVTPNAQGNFSVKMGSSTPLNVFETVTPEDARNLHLQVEVKPAAAPYSAFQILDVNRNNDLIDRSPVLAVPSARNADLLDLRDVGTGSGSIPYLLSGGLMPVGTVPGGTNVDTFIIDANNTAAGEVALKFGASLSEKLSFDITNGRFVFSDDLRVEGDLTVTGLINGVDITSLTEASATHLKVSSGGGLNVDVAGGNYEINGDITNYSGNSGVNVPNNATSYVFFGSGGLTIRSMNFPTDESFIPLAQVVSSGGSIQSVTDMRVLQSDNRENTVLKTFNATFENASYQGDGGDNIGQLSVSHDNINLRNFYLWTTTRSTLQDYDVIQRITLPAGFTGWDTADGQNALAITYRTTSGDVANNKLDIQVFDTNGVPVTLSGSTTNLVSTSWATAQVEFAPGGTWTPGQEFLIRFKFAAKNGYQVQLANFKLRLRELLGIH